MMRSEQESKYTSSIGLATGSSRRVETVESLMPIRVLQFSPVSDEIRSAHPTEIAEGKARDVVHHYSNELTPGSTLLAADSVLLLDKQVLFKPEDLAEAQRNLHSVAQRGTYRVNNGTVLTQTNAEGEITSVKYFPLGTVIEISQEYREWLQTENAWETYLQYFSYLYGDAVTPLKVGGGICVLVLLAMGVVGKIDGVAINRHHLDEEMTEAIYGTIFTTIMSVAPTAIIEAIGLLTSNETDTYKNQADEILTDLSSLPRVQALQKQVERFLDQGREIVVAEMSKLADVPKVEDVR